VTINLRVAELMGKNRLNQKQLSEMTGIRPNTISAMWRGEAKRIELEQIDKLCKALNCTPGELFEYIPDEE
jgi:putative transcriptional regulator